MDSKYSNFKDMSMSELLTSYKANMMTLSTAIDMVLDGRPFPDPREMNEVIQQVTPAEWIDTFHNESMRSAMQENVKLMKVMTEVNNENMVIIQRMLRITA